MLTEMKPYRLLSWLAAYLIVYSAALAWLALKQDFPPIEPLMVLMILGVTFSALAILSTRHTPQQSMTVSKPGSETAIALVYFGFLTSFVTWVMPLVKQAIASPAAGSAALLVTKLIVFVGAPALLIRYVGGEPWRDIFMLRPIGRRDLRPLLAMSVLLIAFQYFFGTGAQRIREASLHGGTLAIALAISFVWLFFEVGIVEEFFFRTILQTRLSRVLRSEAGGVITSALLFALLHVPGLYLRSAATHERVGSHPSLLFAICYSVVITSAAGLFLGALWSRTRNLTLVALVHAAADLLPNVADIAKNLGMLKP